MKNALIASWLLVSPLFAMASDKFDQSVINKIRGILDSGDQMNLVVVTTRVDSALLPPPPDGWVSSIQSSVQTSLSAKLLNTFSKYPNFRLIERENIHQILEELRLQQSGIIRQETTKKIGEITGSNYAIFSEVSRYAYEKKGFIDEYSQRIVNLENGQILAMACDTYDYKARRKPCRLNRD